MRHTAHRQGLGIYWTAAQVREELDRVDLRFQSLARDVEARFQASADPEITSFRSEFLAFFGEWRRFYDDAYDDWLAWGSNVDTARGWDEELDTYAERFTEITGVAPSSPTRSDAADERRRSGSGWLVPMIFVGLGVAALFGIAQVLNSPAVRIAAASRRRRLAKGASS